MKDPAWLEANWGIVERQVKVDKVYLETHRDLIIVDPATLAAAKTFFAKKGIQTAGGIALVRNESNRFETFCYSNAGQRAKVQEIVEATARAFDEIILDDFFFTNTKSDDDIKAKGDRTWTEYRLELLGEVSRNLILKPARAVNPKVKVTIKYPNWYEHFQGNGYNLADQPKIFDKIYTGTETRDSVYNHQHLQPYQSYQQVRYFENIAAGRNGGGWVDTANRIVADRYAEQLWLTLFAKAPEITLFALHELLMPLRDADRAPWQDQQTSFDYARAARPVAGAPAGQEKPTLASAAGVALTHVDAVLGKLGKPIGIKSYKPYNSVGEDFLHNYLGTAGFPIDLYPEFPDDAAMVLLTESASVDATIVAKIKARLRAGKDVMVTSGFLKAVQDKGFRDIAELRVSDHKAITREFWGRNVARQKLDVDILIPEIQYLTNDSWEVISSMTNGLGYPVLHYVPYNKASLFVLTIPENFADLYQYPAVVLDELRRTASKGLFVRLEGPSRVALMAYDNQSVVVESFRDQPAEIRLVTDVSIAKFHNEETGEELVGDQQASGMIFKMTLKPHSFIVLTSK